MIHSWIILPLRWVFVPFYMRSMVYTMPEFAGNKELVRAGRIVTAFVMIPGMMWIPLMKNITPGLYGYLQSVQFYLAPPIAAAFLLGVFFKRINASGAYAAMVTGFIIGIPKLVLELLQTKLLPSDWLYQFATLNFLYFCIYLLLFSIALMVIVSLATPAPSEASLKGLTFGTTVAEDKAASRASWNATDVILSIVAIMIVIAIFITFSPLGLAK